MPDSETRAPVAHVLPEPRDAWEARMPDGASIVIRRHGNPEGPGLIVSHANGLAVDAYYPFWSKFAKRFDVFVHDVRNHGWNPVGDRRLHHVPQFTEDAECIGRSIDERIGARKPRFGVFHSLTAMVALRHATAAGKYAGLVLFDPPVCPPGGLTTDMERIGGKLAEITRRRAERFDSPGDLADSMSRSPVFAGVDPEGIELLAGTTARPSRDGAGYELCCPREYEAQVFEFFCAWSMTVDFESVTCPVKIIGSDPTVRNSFMPSMDLGELIAVDYDFLPETTHLLQLEEPEECAARALEFLEQYNAPQ